MKQKDNTMHVMLEDKRYFADICNVMLFHGEQRIRPEDLTDMDAKKVSTSVLRDGRSNSIDRTRDSLKTAELVRMEKDGTTYVILGIEHQSEIDRGMPMRTMLYDAMQYEEQVLGMKNGKMGKDDRLKPVITMVVYTGSTPWEYPKAFRDIVDMDSIPKELWDFIPDTKMPLLDIRHSRELGLFATELRSMFTATQFHEKSEELQQYMEDPQNGFYDMPQKLAYAFVNIMGMDVHLPEREVVNMCEAIRQIKQQGIEQGQLKALQSLCAKGFSAQEAMELIDIPLEEQEQYQELVKQMDASSGDSASQFQQK